MNFYARLEKDGKVVAGSERRGHNVITDYGRTWMAHLLTWRTIGATDAPYTDARLRWLGVGSGTQPEIPSIINLKNSLPYNATGSRWANLAGSAAGFPEFRTATSVIQRAVFTSGQLSFAGDVIVTEAALVVDVNPDERAGSTASIVESSGVVIVTGLSGMTPFDVHRYLNVSGSDNDGNYKILSLVSESSVVIDHPTASGADSNNGSINTSVQMVRSKSDLPVVAYKTFEGLVKTPSVSLIIDWELKF